MLASLKAFLGSKGNVLLLAGLMLLPGTVLGAQYGFYAGVPTLALGERWDYETRTEGHVRAPVVEVNANMGTDASAAPATASVSTTWDDHPIDDKGAISFRVIDTDAEIAGVPTYRLWTRVEGWASEADITRADLNPIGVKRTTATNGREAHEEVEELPIYRFPLHAGKSWTHEVPEEKFVLTFTVLDRDFRSFKGSALEAYHIRGTIALNEEEFRKAREEGLERADFALDYWYAPAVHGLLELVFRMDLAVREGFSMNLRHTMTLVDHRIDPHSPAEEAVLRHGLTVVGPTALNLAEASQGRYRVTLGNGQKLPDGLDVAWHLGESATGARGHETTVAFRDVAVHRVEAAVMSGGDAFMTAGLDVTAMYSKPFKTAANPVGVKETFEFPVGTIPANLLVLYTPPECLVMCTREKDDVKLLDGASNEIPPTGGPGHWQLNTDPHEPGVWKVALDFGPARHLTGDHTVLVEQNPTESGFRVPTQAAPRASLFAETLGWAPPLGGTSAGAGVVPGALAALGVDT